VCENRENWVTKEKRSQYEEEEKNDKKEGGGERKRREEREREWRRRKRVKRKGTTGMDGDERDDKAGGRIKLLKWDPPFKYKSIYLKKIIMGCFLIGCGVWEKSFQSLFFFYPFSLFCLYAGVLRAREKWLVTYKLLYTTFLDGYWQPRFGLVYIRVSSVLFC